MTIFHYRWKEWMRIWKKKYWYSFHYSTSKRVRPREIMRECFRLWSWSTWLSPWSSWSDSSGTVQNQKTVQNFKLFCQNFKYSIRDNPRLWWLLHRILQLDHDQNFLSHIWTSTLMLNPTSLLTSLDEDNERMLVVNSQGDTELDSVRWE